MRVLAAAAALLAYSALVLGQEQNNTFLNGLLQNLNSSGYTQLVGAIGQINASTAGPSVLRQFSSGRPFVLFAPSNEAFSNAPANLTDTLDKQADIIAYHIVVGNFTGVNTTYPNTTIGRTLMSDPAVVQLETTGQHQVVAWATREDGRVHVLNQANDTVITNTSTFENVTIFTIDHVLNYPGPFNETVAANNASLSSLAGVFNSLTVPFFNSSTNQTTNTSLTDVVSSGLRGFTLFAPNNTAIDAAASNISCIQANQTSLAALVQNHFINGSTTYSPLLASQNQTSAAGEPLDFVLNATGHYVTSGNVTALIVQPDVLLPNGVIHVIDRVLINTQSDAAAATSAISSASSVAVTQTESATAPIGFSATATLAGPETTPSPTETTPSPTGTTTSPTETTATSPPPGTATPVQSA